MSHEVNCIEKGWRMDGEMCLPFFIMPDLERLTPKLWRVSWTTWRDGGFCHEWDKCIFEDHVWRESWMA